MQLISQFLDLFRLELNRTCDKLGIHKRGLVLAWRQFSTKTGLKAANWPGILKKPTPLNPWLRNRGAAFKTRFPNMLPYDWHYTNWIGDYNLSSLECLG